MKLEREHNHNRQSRSHEQNPILACHCPIQSGIALFLQVRGGLSVEAMRLSVGVPMGIAEAQQIGAGGCDP